MSFFKKLTQEFDTLTSSFGDKKDENPAQSHGGGGQRDYPQPGYHQPYQGGGSPYPPQQQQSYPPQGYQGGQPPYQQHHGYSSPPEQQPYQGYGAPPPQQHGYGAPPPSGPPSGPPMPENLPPLPQGWVAQWDPQQSRYYYAEQATGRTQWERPLPPGYSANPPMGDSDHTRGHGVPYAGGHGDYPHGGQYGGGHGGHGGYGGHHGDSHYGDGHHKEKKSGKSGMLMGAAGGLAVGAIGGALVANALSDSDDEQHHHHYYGAPAPQAGYGGYQDPSMPPAVLPPTDADGSSVSSSDREEVEEAREEYEEALRNAADSDASSSDLEELEEAREEYEEIYEEVYED